MKLVGRVVLVAVAYWVAGRFALMMAIPPGYATAVWPAAGIGLVALLRWGRPAMVGVYLGSFVVNVAPGFDAIAIALVVALGAVFEATVGAALIRRRVRAPTMLEEEGDVVRFIGLGGPVACLIGATWGVGTLVARGALTWADVPFSWFTWWVGDAVGVALVAAPLLMQVGTERPSPRRRLAVAGPMLAGVVGVIFVFVQVSAFEDHRRRDQLVQRAVPITHAIEARLGAYEQSVMMVGSLFAASEHVTADEFRIFTAPLLARNPEIEGVSWDPVEGARVPIRYMEPATAAVAGVIGFDIAAEPIRREALERARRTRAPAATGALTLLQDAAPPGFLLVAPVFAGPRLRGYAVGVLAIDAVVTAAITPLDIDGLALQIEDEASTGAVIYRRGDAVQGAPWWTAHIDVGGRRWRVDVAPTPAYFGALRSWLGWIVLAGGLVFVSLLGMLTLVTTGRTSRIERAAERTAAAEIKYRDLYEHAPDLHASLDLDGRVFDCNQTFVDAVGLAKLDLIGRSLIELHDPSCAAALAAAVTRFRSHGTVDDTNLVLRVRGGRTLDVSLRVAAVLDARGALAHGRAVWRDVSARRQAERDQLVLLELSEAAGRAEHVAELRLAVARGLGAHLGATRCIFHEIDLAGDSAEIDGDYHHGVPALTGTRYTLSQFSAATQADMRAGRMVVNDDVRADPRTADGSARGYAPLAVRAYIAVPLLRDGVWRASLWIAHAEAHVWRPHEIALVHTIAEKSWLWIEHVRLRAELRALNEELEHRVDDRTAALRDAVREKEILLKEIHHRVKNNLQVISSLLSLQSHHLVDPVARQMFEDSKARVQAIAMVHESLYRTRDLAKIDFAEYVQTLVGGLLHAHDGAGRGVHAALDLGHARLPVNIAIPCGLVISELVTNALKHAFPAGRPGTLRVSLRVDGARATLTVADDGVGLPPDLDPRRSPSLGLELVFTFAEQLQATVDLRRDPGTSFTFGFELEAA